MIYSYFEYFIFFYSSAMLLSLLLLGIFSSIKQWRFRVYNSKQDDLFLMNSSLTPGISIIAPAFNEERTIIDNVKSLLTMEYPTFEVIIVNDGSTDRTLEILIREYDLEETAYAYDERIKTAPFKRIFRSRNPLYSNLTIVDKVNGGTKADASNAGINASKYPYFICTDVDCILDRKTMLKMIKPILNSKNRTIAVGAVLRMSNSCDIKNGVITRVRPPRKLIPRFQELEYMRSYLFGKLGWSFINCVPNVSGGLGLFDKEVAINAGGYDGKSHAEDMDLLTKMVAYMCNSKQKYTVDYIPVSCCWTEGPSNLKILARQRIRWATGLAQIFFVHRKVFFNPSYPKLGFIVFPYIFLFEFLAPIIEAFGLFWFLLLIIKGDVNWDTVAFMFLYVYSFGIAISSLVVFMDYLVKRQYKTFWETFSVWVISLIEGFIYHPFIIYFSIVGYIRYFTSRKIQWGTMTRQGFDIQPEIEHAK